MTIEERAAQAFQKKCGATICKELKGIETGTPLCPCPECVRSFYVGDVKKEDIHAKFEDGVLHIEPSAP